MKHIVALSGGKDSTAMALRLAEVEPREYLFVCTPTGDELPEMFEHWKRLAVMLEPHGKFVPLVANTLDKLIEGYNALPNWRQRWCTRQLKIEPFKLFLLQNLPCTSYVGLRADEEARDGVAYDNAEGVTHRYPMREWGWSLSDVVRYLDKQKIEIPERTDCGRCFFQTLGEWWKLWRDNNEVYVAAEQQERDTGYTFRSPGRDSWPPGLAELRLRFEAGEVPGNANQMDLFRSSTCRVCSL